MTRPSPPQHHAGPDDPWPGNPHRMKQLRFERQAHELVRQHKFRAAQIAFIAADAARRNAEHLDRQRLAAAAMARLKADVLLAFPLPKAAPIATTSEPPAAYVGLSRNAG